MNEELKPYPFCGGKARLRWSVFFHTEVFVKCDKCKCRTVEYKGTSHEDMKYLAIEAWNRRVNDETN